MDNIDAFLSKVPNSGELLARELIEIFVYYLTARKGESAVSAAQVKACFVAANIPPHSNISQYFTRHSKGSRVRFVKKGHGYRLTRLRKLELDEILGKEQTFRETSTDLRKLLERVTSESEVEFLKETIYCFETHAYRAAIAMGWLLTVDHLYEYILAKKLREFNVQLAKANDRRVKVTSISNRDDFTEIPESKFIELCRSARIISADVRKILNEKLGIRNSCAHPSGIKVSQHKATEFLNDLVQNVVVKYEI